MIIHQKNGAEGMNTEFVLPVKDTTEMTIVICQCGCTTFNIETQTKTAVSLACSKCGCKTSVKGPVATAEVPDKEVVKAKTNIVAPDPDYKPAETKSSKNKDPQSGDSYTIEGSSFDLHGGENLKLEINGDIKNIYFQKDDFKSAGFATTEEVSNRIIATLKDDMTSEVKKSELKILTIKTGQNAKIRFISGTALEPLGIDVYMNLRFRVSMIAKEKTIDAAMEAIRIINFGDNRFKNQSWQGHALEYLAADFLAGCDPAITALVYENKQKLKDLTDEVTKDEKGKSYSARKARELNQRLIKSGAEQLGLIENASNVITKEENQDDDRINDDGRLTKAMKTAFLEYTYEYNDETGKTIPVLLGVPLEEATKQADKHGGFVIEILGDERTKTKAGKTPVFYMWLENEPNDRGLELEIEYSDHFEDDLPTAEIKVIEILPKNWEEINDESRWNKPSFCIDRRIME